MTSTHNDDKTAVEVTLDAEEMEEVIAPGITMQHNETLVSD